MLRHALYRIDSSFFMERAIIGLIAWNIFIMKVWSKKTLDMVINADIGNKFRS